MAYLLDSNVFIRAKNEYYGFDICPGFWDWLDAASQQGDAMSVEAVYDELAPQADPLAEWVRGRRPMFQEATGEIVAAAQQVNAWAFAHPDFSPEAKNDFAAVADSWLVAHAIAGQHVVVTHELLGQYKRRIIKIPNAAHQFGVRVVQPHQMLRELGAQFVWTGSPSQEERLF